MHVKGIRGGGQATPHTTAPRPWLCFVHDGRRFYAAVRALRFFMCIVLCACEGICGGKFT